MHIPDELRKLGMLFQEAGARLYAVGGLPRNALLGLPPSDIDICSALTPDAVASLCEAHAPLRCIPKAPAFGTVEIHMNGICFEHTTFRGDIYGAGGTHRPDSVRFTDSLEADAFRRDFSCNALYLDVLENTLQDPTGGIADIHARVLRATSKDPATILRDDALRVLRMVRFAGELGFTVDEGTFTAALSFAGGLSDIAAERKRDELSKILLSDARYPTLHQAGESPVYAGLCALHKLGALPHLLPELLEGDGIPQRPQYHRYDVLQHNLHTAAHTPPELTLRLAGLLHDVGKPAALRENRLSPTDGGYNEPPVIPGDSNPMRRTPMLNHDKLGASVAEQMLNRLRYPAALVQDVLFLVEHHMYDLTFRAKQATLRGRFAEIGQKRTEQLISIREADFRGSGYCDDFVAAPWRAVYAAMRAEGAPFSLAELRCTGKDIMAWLNLPPGPAIGVVKERLLRHCARIPADNTPARLEKIARGHYH